MNVNRIFYSIVFLLAAGCASSNVEKKAAELPAEAGQDTAYEYDYPQKKAAAPSKGAFQQVAPSQFAPLSEAIRANNDEKIYKVATEILTQNPNEPKALNALGLYHLKKGQFLAAQMFFGKALQVEPKSADIHNNMGLAYLGLKEEREALKSFRKAIEINPNDAISANNLTSIYIEVRDFEKAKVTGEIAYKNSPRELRAINNFAVIMAATGKPQQAELMYKDALSLSPNNKEVLFNYASLLVQNLSRPQEGLDLLAKIKFLGPVGEMRNRINVLDNLAKAGLK